MVVVVAPVPLVVMVSGGNENNDVFWYLVVMV